MRTAWLYLSTSTPRRLAWLARGPVLAALYPVTMPIGQLLLAVLGASVLAGAAGYLPFRGGEMLTGLIGVALDTGGFIWTLVGAVIFWLIFLPAVVISLRWFKSKDDKTFAYFLMNDYAYTASRRCAYPD